MNTTVRFVENKTVVRFVSRTTTVRFPSCTMSQEQFNAMMDAWVASLQSFANNEAAAAVLAPGKTYKFSSESDVGNQGSWQTVI